MILKNFVEIINPIMIRKSDVETNFKLISPSCIKDSKVISYDFAELSKIVPEKYSLKKGDVLFQAKGNRFDAILIEDEIENLYPNSMYFIIRSKKDKLNPKYLQWLLKTSEAESYFNKNTSGSTISIVRKAAIESFSFKLPSLEVQNELVSLINSFEIEKIETENYLTLKKEIIEKKILSKYEVS